MTILKTNRVDTLENRIDTLRRINTIARNAKINENYLEQSKKNATS